MSLTTSRMPNKIGTMKQQSNSKSKVPGRPFPKGTSGNPKGRPKRGLSIAETLREIGNENMGAGDKRTKLLAMADAAYELALGGDKDMVKFIADRTEGRAHQSLEVTNPDKLDVDEVVVNAKTTS